MVTITDLCKQYDGFDLNISMEIPAGCITGLIGRNGAGKSTTIKSILGLVSPDSGSVQVLGKEAAELTRSDKERIGAAVSDMGFSEYLTVNDIAGIMSRLYGRFDAKAFVRECRNNGLPDKKQIKTFSTGMKAKLRVLTALSHDADLLIVDEPTAGLDVSARNEILDILRNYMAENENRSILITSHIAADLEGLCDDIYMIHDGKIILHEDTDVILSDYAIIKADKEQFKKLDSEYILTVREETFGYVCLTNQRQFYTENHPDLVIEKSGIDELILMMTGGK